MADLKKGWTPAGENKPEKKPKKKRTAKQKGIIAAVIVAVVLLLVGIAGYVVTHMNNYGFYNKVVVALAPDKIEDYGKTFYLKVNPAYDQKEAPNEPMFICYYLNDNGKEVDLPSGTYKEDGNNGQVLIAFLGKVAEKVTSIQKAVTITVWVLVGIAVCVLIYIWYRLDARYEERQKLAAHGGKEIDKKKRKK